MMILRRSLAVCLTVLLVAPLARAQGHVIERSALDKAVQERVSQDQADRDVIVSFLRRAEVREAAARAGLSLEKAEAAVSTLQGEDLRDLADQSRQIEGDLAGGASTLVISTTTIIIILLLIILIVVIAD